MSLNSEHVRHYGSLKRVLNITVCGDGAELQYGIRPREGGQLELTGAIIAHRYDYRDVSTFHPWLSPSLVTKVYRGLFPCA